MASSVTIREKVHVLLDLLIIIRDKKYHSFTKYHAMF